MLRAWLVSMGDLRRGMNTVKITLLSGDPIAIEFFEISIPNSEN